VIITHISVSAPIERVFDLSRSIDLHVESTSQTGEKAIAGVTSGLIELDQTVTWKARHFGIWQTLTSKITKFDRPNSFQDCMVSGAFRYFTHDHIFSYANNTTLITDRFEFASPFGILGKMVDSLIMNNHLKKLLLHRNAIIKETAESPNWIKYINAA
jgi:ligand-binding SRPBCC domain-containing protein